MGTNTLSLIKGFSSKGCCKKTKNIIVNVLDLIKKVYSFTRTQSKIFFVFAVKFHGQRYTIASFPER